MFGKYLKINNRTMPNPNPGSFSYKLNPQENTYTSEAGDELTEVVRLDRLSFKASFNCSSSLKEELEALCKTARVTVSIDNGAAITGRLRLAGDISLVANSERTPGTQGLWVVPVSFEGQ